MRRLFIVALIVGTCFAASEGQAKPKTATAVAGGRSRGVFLSETRLRTLRRRVAARVEPTYTAWRALKASADRHVTMAPDVPARWHVPPYYTDAEGHGKAKMGLMRNANATYQLALVYRMTGDEKYAAAAARLIDAWTVGVKQTSRKDDSTLSFCYHFPPMLFGADLIAPWPGWPAERQRAFRRFVRETALPLNCMSGRNNWGNWGLVVVLGAARYLDDQKLFAKGVARWKEFIETQIAADGHMVHEVRRGGGQRGIWYSQFSLMPQTIAAEVARLGGVDLYDYVSPSKRTLRTAFERIVAWTRRPATFPYWKGDPGRLGGLAYYSYWEILNARWPNADATALLATRRPMTSLTGVPALTFTHGGLLRDDGKPRRPEPTRQKRK